MPSPLLPRLYRPLTVGAADYEPKQRQEDKGRLLMNRSLRIASTLAILLSLLTVTFEAELALGASATTATITKTTAPSAPTGTTTANTTATTPPTAGVATASDTETASPLPTTASVKGR